MRRVRERRERREKREKRREEKRDSEVTLCLFQLVGSWCVTASQLPPVSNNHATKEGLSQKNTSSATRSLLTTCVTISHARGQINAISCGCPSGWVLGMR